MPNEYAFGLVHARITATITGYDFLQQGFKAHVVGSPLFNAAKQLTGHHLATADRVKRFNQLVHLRCTLCAAKVNRQIPLLVMVKRVILDDIAFRPWLFVKVLPYPTLKCNEAALKLLFHLFRGHGRRTAVEYILAYVWVVPRRCIDGSRFRVFAIRLVTIPQWSGHRGNEIERCTRGPDAVVYIVNLSNIKA